MTFKEFLILESRAKHHNFPHLFKNANMTFSEIRAVLNNLFTCNVQFSDVLAEDDVGDEVKEINAEIAECIKGTIKPQDALKEVLESLDKIAESVGYKATLNDYIKDAFAKKIVKCAHEHDIDVNKNSLFVSELADRLNILGFKRPTKSDLATFAKREGIKPSDSKYTEFLTALDEAVEVSQMEITHPVEEMLVNCAKLLGKIVLLPACIEQTNESKQFCKCCDRFYKNYSDKKLEINDNSIGDVREFLTNIQDYINHAKAMNKLTFKLGPKMYRLSTTLPNIECFKDIVEF